MKNRFLHFFINFCFKYSFIIKNYLLLLHKHRIKTYTDEYILQQHIIYCIISGGERGIANLKENGIPY
jgi:hypothetical protein